MTIARSIVQRWVAIATLKSAFGLLAARAMVQLSMLAASALVARWLGPAEFGTYAALFALGTVIVGGAGGGLNILGLRSTAQRNFDRRYLHQIGRSGIAINIGAAGIVAICAALTIPVPRAGLLGLVSGASFVAFSMMLLGSGLHSGARNLRKAAKAEAGVAALLTLLTLAALALDLGVTGALLAFGIAAACGAAYLWFRLPAPPDSFDSAVSRFRLADAIPFVALGLLGGGYARLDAVVIATIASTSVVGYYAAAYRVLGIFGLLGSTFATVFFGRLSELDAMSDEFWRIRKRGTLLFLLATLPIAAVLFAFAPTLVRLVYGSEFAAAVTPARWLLLSVIPYALYWPTAQALNARSGERTLIRVLVCGWSVDLALVVALVPHLGPSGAAIAWVVSETVILCGVSFVLGRLSTVRPPSTAERSTSVRGSREEQDADPA